MLILFDGKVRPADRRRIAAEARRAGLAAVPVGPQGNDALLLKGDLSRISPARFEGMPGVRQIVPTDRPYRLVGRAGRTSTVVRIGNVAIGGRQAVVIAGPCAVETEAQMMRIAESVRRSGASILRGGAFKPRTSPYSFQGLGILGLEVLARARERTGLPVVTEAVDVEGVEAVEEYADMIQIGARNMQNFSLLKRAGRSARPVLLKRGISATIEEWLMAAEYVVSAGNPNVVLCERGIRTYADYTRNTLDLSAVPTVKRLSHLPVIVDPSHGTGRRDLVGPLAAASVAAGADGLMVEVHDAPARALSDGAQSLPCAQFARLMKDIRRWGGVSGKSWSFIASGRKSKAPTPRAGRCPAPAS